MPAERVHTRVIPGAHGMGKVTVVMKPIKRRSIIPKILGLIVYPIFFAIMFVSFSWSRPHLRFNYTLPAFSKAFQAIDAIKSFISEARYPLEINDKDFTIIGQTSLEDTVRSQGYVHAMERLFQMEIYRRAALGTLSEVFGNRTTYLDVYSRTLDFASMAREDFLSLDAKTQGVLQNYAQGINDYVSREKKATFPLNFDFSVGIWSSLFGGAEKEIDLRDLRPWTAQDSLAVLRMFLYERSHGWEDDILVHMTKELDIITGQSAASLFAQGREQQREGVALLQGLGGLIVAVGAEASASGKSMLAYNYYSTSRHQGFLYRNCLYGGSLKACGLSLPGVPLLLFGRNDALSWALMASARSEWEQLFQASAIAPLSHTQERAEVIAIAGSDQPKTILVRSHNGDLEVQDLLTANLHHVGDIGKLMLRSAFLTHRLDFSAFITLVTASTPQELPELALAGMPVDIVYASTDGTVGVRRGRLQAVAANASSPMTAIPRAVRDSSSSEDLSTTRVIISGAKDLLSSIGGVDGGACTSSALCQLVDRVAQGKKMEESALWDALHDTWSPSGYRLSSAIFRLFFRDPAVSPALQSFDEALATFDGQYSATALAPTLIEIVRAHLFNFLQTSLAIIDQGQPWSRFAAHNNQYASLLAGQNMTALPRLSVLTHRTEGIASLLERAEFSPGLRDFLGNGTEHGLSWLREHFPNNVFQPSSKQQGNAAAWLWGQIHAKSIPHVLDPMGKFQDAVLALGPMEGAGGLDSAWLASYSGTVIGHHLLGRQDLHSRRNDLHTAVAMMVTMADGEGESITAEGLGLRSQHDARPCPRYAAFQRATWAGVLSVLDAFTGRYHEKRR